MYSITMKCWPERSSRPESKICTMFGWIRRAAACASRWKRDTNVGIVREVLGEQLDRHVALQAHVEREVHR